LIWYHAPISTETISLWPAHKQIGTGGYAALETGLSYKAQPVNDAT